MDYVKETLVSAGKAQAILGDAYVPGQDYYLCDTADGAEVLVGWGEEKPAAVNRTQTSWHSPGFPS